MHWREFHQILCPDVWGLPGLLYAVVLLGAGAPGPAGAQSASDSTDWVQVRLHHGTNVESVRLTPEQNPLSVLLPRGNSPVLRLDPRETVTLGRRQGDVYARRGEANLYARSLRLAPSSGGGWTLTLPSESTRTYTGHLHLRPADSSSGLQLVNRVPLQDYVASVVAAEYGLGDRAGTRAMAIVARTYALFAAKHHEDDYDHVDGTASQVYRGQEVITEAARRAARETQGQILTYDGAPIQAVYFSSSGGHTANNEDVWTDSPSLPYLRGKEDPYDQVSPKHRWTTRVNRRALLQALSLHHGASVEGFLLGDRTSNGRLATVDVLFSTDGETEMEASTFRSVVNERVDGVSLKSTWFDARRDGSEYVFTGQGHGHGVGLNQWGAHAMAEQGKSYREILSFYYTGVQIRPLDEASSLPAVAQDPPPPADSTAPRIGW
ncbi:MAG: SpoIID/LytB domain-containing protein [Salinibacter sp.]|uniref:SpoIID/LytB domain-containing protein n=1 Tax=Salinibacter sp. TaxID=2065818 RepID=UPI002FC311A3